MVSCPNSVEERAAAVTPPALVANARAPSCGIAKNANPAQVSGACNCIIASSTVKTVTSSTTTCQEAVPTLFSLQVAPGSGVYSGKYAVLNTGDFFSRSVNTDLDKRIVVANGAGTIDFSTSDQDDATIFALTGTTWTSAAGMQAYLDNTC